MTNLRKAMEGQLSIAFLIVLLFYVSAFSLLSELYARVNAIYMNQLYWIERFIKIRDAY